MKAAQEMLLSEKGNRLCRENIFGNSNPVEIEIGSGRGRFLIRRAVQNPLINLIGIERALKFYRILKEKVGNLSLKNVRVVHSEAEIFIRLFIPPQSVSVFHVYFPDPWPKTRHRKRRIVKRDFMDMLHNHLVDEGLVCFATDYKDYFDWIVRVVGSCEGWEKVYCKSLNPEDADPEEAPTSYERKYIMQGRQIYKAAYKKADKSS